MNARRQTGRDAPLLFGALLVAGGVIALGLQQAGVRIWDLVGEAGWPFFVIVPGLVLVGTALVVPRPRGIGFAVAGAIVTTVGLILLYQNATGAWESWAYAWALIPTAAGVGMTLYGAIAADRGMSAAGARLAAIGAIMFLAGLWFFGPVFGEGRVPLDLDQWWPAALVAVGVVIVGSALVGSRRGGSDHLDQGRPA